MSQVTQNINNTLNVLSMALGEALHKWTEALSKRQKAVNKRIQELGKPVNKALSYGQI